MPPVAQAALRYLVPVFAVAFALGALRGLLIAPQIGAFAAVALEVPVLLALSWVVAGRVLRTQPLSPAERWAMGGLAFGLLMLAELALVLAFGQTAMGFLAEMGTPAGALGLAGQIGFAAIPGLRDQPRG
jgi:hypothetical protein